MIDRFELVGADAVPLGETLVPLGVPAPGADAHASVVAAAAMRAIW
jgi:hypothetical protein